MRRPRQAVLAPGTAAAAGGMALAGALPAAAAPIPVCPAGCDYISIQAAISAAPSGALIGVEAGTYDGLLTIGKSLTLAGAGASLTTITVPRSDGTVITVETGASATVRAVSIAGGDGKDGGGIFDQPGGGADRPGQHARQQHRPRHRRRHLQLRRGHAGPGWLPAQRQHRHLRGRGMVNPGGTVAPNGTTVTANRALHARAGASATTAP